MRRGMTSQSRPAHSGASERSESSARQRANDPQAAPGTPAPRERVHRDGWRSGADSPETDQEHPVDAEDHARAGVDRGEPDRPRAGDRRSCTAVQRVDHPGRARPRGRRGNERQPAPHPSARRPQDRVHRHRRRSRSVRCLQLLGDPRRGARDPGSRAHAGSTTRSSSSDARPRATSATANTGSTPRSTASRSVRRTRTPARSVRQQPGCSSKARSTSSRSCTRASCRSGRRLSSSTR